MSRQDLALEQSILRSHRALIAKPHRVLMALSGGCDSMVMGEILRKWQRGLKIELAVCHVHHGLAQAKDQTAYRDRAQRFVGKWAETHGLKFYTNDQAPSKTLKSEKAWREWRECCIRHWVEQSGFETVAMAHHQDDLLETRMLRLVRGTGAQGILSMSEFKNGRWRPLLGISRIEIVNYAESTGLKWIEDPSNVKTDALRNWMRREWLPMLEARQSGALKTLARSLDNLVPDIVELDLLPFVGLRRDELSRVEPFLRREIVVRYLKALGLSGYQRSHVEEIIKRAVCDDVRHRPKANIKFKILGMNFHLSPDFVWARRV